MSRTVEYDDKLLVYSDRMSERLEESNHYLITVSSSEGFKWNQDIFASQYQQSYRVVYDGYDDSYDDLLESFEAKLKQIEVDDIDGGTWPPYNQADIIDDLLFRLQSQLRRSRRKSVHSISFLSDSKTGNFSKQIPVHISIDEETNEDDYFKWLAS
ncbi:hypothetical protein TPHA_0F03020 [Tetrapisispora phaffii CBS 4417]|uniref:Uncharacterized protein n=1 Tax=Tetrapisispora phaffii (strain ATCC 24235 / CBS 4417 / NBRC 1672 / NRRL Y-8282 / UCD 70-5) TaxID=1071381 RepID=G8BUJ7_TETPH|nr:hypothetical protein TPHA_0F03020 [Tetrapisispora phaffii CBS 4417]CCE63783.1 hypothetical protein TPHA_0F03020 [Tetrapisispora phaffii CBS 4417]